MVELGKFNLKINVIPNELEKYITFNINNNLVFIDSFQSLCSLSDSLVKNLGENDLKYLIQESDNNILDLVKQKGCYNEYISDLKKIHYSLTGKKLVIKIMHMILKFGINLK